jgi:hypothetical protein
MQVPLESDGQEAPGDGDHRRHRDDVADPSQQRSGDGTGGSERFADERDEAARRRLGTGELREGVPQQRHRDPGSDDRQGRGHPGRLGDQPEPEEEAHRRPDVRHRGRGDVDDAPGTTVQAVLVTISPVGGLLDSDRGSGSELVMAASLRPMLRTHTVSTATQSVPGRRTTAPRRSGLELRVADRNQKYPLSSQNRADRRRPQGGEALNGRRVTRRSTRRRTTRRDPPRPGLRRPTARVPAPRPGRVVRVGLQGLERLGLPTPDGLRAPHPDPEHEPAGMPARDPPGADPPDGVAHDPPRGVPQEADDRSRRAPPGPCEPWSASPRARRGPVSHRGHLVTPKEPRKFS